MNPRKPSFRFPSIRGLQGCGAAVVLLFASGCSHLDSTTKRSSLVALGSATGAASGYALGDGSAGATAGGAVAGAALAHVALGRDPAVLQQGFDQGYIQGQSDAIKRQYFLRQSLEKRPLSERSEGAERTYVLPAPTDDDADAKAQPSQIAIRIVE